MGSREDSLGFLALCSESSECSWIAFDVDASLLFEVTHAEIDKLVIEVLAAQVSVPIGGLDLKDTLLDGEERDIECTSSKIENQYISFLRLLPVKTISNSSSSWLVDDSEHLHSSNGPSIFSSLSLRIIEVGRHSDDSRVNLLAEIRLSNLLHLGQHHGRYLLRLEPLGLALVLHHNHRLVIGAGLNPERPKLDIALDSFVREFASDESLGVEDCVERIPGCLVLGSVANESLLISEGYVGGRSIQSLVIGHDLDLVVLPDAHARVRGAQIDSDSGFSSCF